jgi:CBS domain containing-hemolysin-like protein
MIFVLSLAEASLLAVSVPYLRHLADRGDRRAQVAQRLRAGDDFLSALILGINASVILVATVMTVLVRWRLGSHADWETELWHAGTILFILVVAELTPKTWGTVKADQIALVVAPFIAHLTAAAAPAVRVVTAIGSGVARLTGCPAQRQHRFISAAEIQAAADISEEEGLVEPEEGEMLDNVIELKETVAREIMVPRVDIVAVPLTVDIHDIVATAVESGHSRIPVYENTIDTIVGIIYVADLLRAFHEGRRNITPADVMRPPMFVPETKRVSDLFHELREKRVHIAIVLDEFGGTEGLVTVEDILEELVGEIRDEHDALEETIIRLDDKTALVDGNARIEEVNEQLGLNLPDDEYETLGGLMAGRTGKIPEVGERIQEGDVELLVEQGTEQHVERIRVTKLTREDGER